MDEKKKWKLVGSKPVFESKWLTVEDRSYELPDGTRVEGYLHLNRKDYVLVLALDEKDRVVVERQYRRGVDDFVFELPAGWIEEGESPIEAARRELKEETGYSGEGKIAAEFYVQPGFSSVKAFLAILKITDVGNHLRESDEDMDCELMEINRIKEMISNGTIKDMGFLSAFSVFENLKK